MTPVTDIAARAGASPAVPMLRDREARLLLGSAERARFNAWNNIGRVVCDDGVVECVSTCRDPEEVAIERAEASHARAAGGAA